MNRLISSRDWETLSAYLDGQLSTKERSLLESRLAQTAELRRALDELRRTRAILRSQPRLRAPRNFTLSAAVLGIRPAVRSGLGWFSGLRLTSALASLMFFLVLAGDLLAVGRQPAGLMMAAQPADAIQTEAVSEQAVAQESLRQQLEQPAPSTNDGAASTAASDQTAPIDQTAPSDQTAPVEKALAPPAPTDAGVMALAIPPTGEAYPPPEALLGASAKLAGTPAVGETLDMTSTLRKPPAEILPTEPELALELQPQLEAQAETTGEEPLLGAPLAGQSETEVQSPESTPAPAGFNMLRLVEGALAIAALVAGLAAYFLWRSGRV